MLTVAVGSAQAALPKRIVSLSPTATETLFAIGAGKQVIAVDDQSNYPANAPKTKLSGFTPNVEAIAAYKPQLVIIAFDSKGLKKSLEALKIKVYYQPPPINMDGAYAQIKALGDVSGNPAKARVLISGMKVKIAKIVAQTPRPAAPLSVFHEIDNTLYSATSATFIGQVYKDLGLRNIADGAPDAAGLGYPQLSSEYVVTQNPDFVVLTDGEDPVKVATRPGWSLMKAVKRGTVAPVSADISSRWGPRIVGLYKVMSGRVTAVAGK